MKAVPAAAAADNDDFVHLHFYRAKQLC